MGRLYTKPAIALAGISLLSAQPAGVPDMLERVLPAVVTVAVNQVSQAKSVFGAVASSSADAAYERVLDLSGVKGSGSGFVIERNGKKYVVTNAHVVENAVGPDAIVAFSIDRTRYEMRLAGADSLYDLALLEFTNPQPGKELRTLEFRPDEPRIGEAVYAIGNPLGNYPYTVTSGIVSGKNRMFYDLTGKFGYLQSSATTIWGNSGGPLVDERGRVLGVNSRIEVSERQQTFVHPQLNFALQSSLSSRIVAELLANHGRLIRAYLGIEIRHSIRPQKGAAPDEARPEIAALIPDGPAEKALEGKIGYSVERINRSPVHLLEDALAALEKVRPGGTVTLQVRNSAGETENIEIKAGLLDERNLSAIALFVLKNDVSFEAAVRDGGVVLERASAAGDPNLPKAALRLVQLRQEPDAERSPASPPSLELTLAAIGLIGEDDALLYRVSDLSSAGAAIKLVSMSGRIDMLCVPKGGAEPVAARFRFSAEPSVAARTLLY